MARNWTKEEDAYLRANLHTKSNSEIGRHLGRSTTATAKRIGRLGLRRTDGTVSEARLAGIRKAQEAARVAAKVRRAKREAQKQSQLEGRQEPAKPAAPAKRVFQYHPEKPGSRVEQLLAWKRKTFGQVANIEKKWKPNYIVKTL